MSRFLPFTEARDFARSLKLFNFTEWGAWCKTEQHPANIPSRPDVVYKEVWVSWGDFLGGDWVGRHRHCKKLLPYAEAREFARALKLSGVDAWYEWSKSGQRPAGIPGNPRCYRQEWTCWSDWLGHGDGRGRKRLSSAERVQRLAEREQKKADRLAARIAELQQRLTESEQQRVERLERLAENEQRRAEAKRQEAEQREAARHERERRKREEADRIAQKKRQRREEANRLALRRETEKRGRMLAAEQVRADIARRRDEIRRYKEETRYKSHVKIVFFERCDSADRFWTLADAEAAAAEYSADRRYGCEAFRCEKCKAWHVRPRPLAGRVFMHPETKRWCITLPVAVDPKVERWSAENLAKFRANKRAAAVPDIENLCIGSAETGVLVMDECLSTC